MNLYRWLYTLQQIVLCYHPWLMPWATVYLLRRCLSTRCTEVKKVNKEQELVKLPWQLSLWPWGVWSAPLHGLWIPLCSLWKVTLAWWARMSLQGFRILQPTGRRAINPNQPSFWKQSATKSLIRCPGHRRLQKTSLFLVQLFLPVRT